MNHPRRLASFFTILGLLLLGGGSVSRAQTTTNQDARYLYADTTLVRDTLGLTFERLFPLADSLQMSPENLRKLSVTYRWTLARLIKMADSLQVPIDSVGPIMLRERFNPLAAAAFVNTMNYTSSFFRNKDNSSWRNSSEYSINRGGLYATNNLSVDFDRSRSAGSRTRRRSSGTELGWKIARQMSIGGTAKLTGYDNVSRSGTNDEEDRTTEFGGTFNARPAAFHGLTATLYGRGGRLSSSKISGEKSGSSGEANSTLRYAIGTWLSTDVRVSGTGAVSNAQAVDLAPDDDVVFPVVRARDTQSNVSGTFSLFRNRPAEFLMNYRLTNSRTQQPVGVLPDSVLGTPPLTGKQLIRTTNNGVDATLRFQQTPDRTLSLQWNRSLNDNATASDPTRNNSRESDGFSATARVRVSKADFDGSFRLDNGEQRYPRRDRSGGYSEDGRTRALNGRMNYQASRRLTFTLDGSISLTRNRYARIDSPLTVPVPHDNASQSYRGGIHFDFSRKGGTDVRLEVRKNRSVNIPAASTASNNEQRSYSASWSWNYQLLPGLTTNQNNQMNADYYRYPFSPTANRLSLSYYTTTTVSAVLSPRIDLRVTHSSRVQPAGNYLPASTTDPTEYFGLSDRTSLYSIRTELNYRPMSAMALSLIPDYRADRREATINGDLAPQRISRVLDLAGAVTLNLRLGANGTLNGDVRRNFNTNRTIDYRAATSSPRAESSNWSSSLQLQWHL